MDCLDCFKFKVCRLEGVIKCKANQWTYECGTPKIVRLTKPERKRIEDFWGRSKLARKDKPYDSLEQCLNPRKIFREAFEVCPPDCKDV